MNHFTHMKIAQKLAKNQLEEVHLAKFEKYLSKIIPKKHLP